MSEHKRYIVAEDLLTGHETIDSQHVELFNRLNSVLDAAEQKKSVMEVRKFVLFLADYIREHLELEEQIMNSLTFPDKDNHFQEHDHFRSSIYTIIDNFSNDKITYNELIIALQTRIGDWFINHINRTDREMVSFIQNSEQ